MLFNLEIAVPLPNPIVYARRLFERRHEAAPVQPANVGIGEWKPEPNQCHSNAITWCESNPDFEVVHGWLCFDTDAAGFARFVSHSVVRRSADNTLFDITPQDRIQQDPYPFLVAEEGADEFAEFVTSLPSGSIDHVLGA